jgi:hypothetical protein
MEFVSTLKRVVTIPTHAQQKLAMSPLEIVSTHQLQFKLQMHVPPELVMQSKELSILQLTVKMETNVQSTTVTHKKDANTFQNSLLKIVQQKVQDVMEMHFVWNILVKDVSKSQLELANLKTNTNAILQPDLWETKILRLMLVMMEILAPLTNVTQQPTNVFTLDQNALITMFVPSTNAIMEFVTILKRKIVTIATHVLLILVMLFLDANTLHCLVTTTMFAPLILAILQKDVSILLQFATITTHALMILAMLSKDVSQHQNTFATTTNAQENNAMLWLEMSNMFQLIVTITTLAQLILAILKLDALTLLLLVMTKTLAQATLATNNKDANTLLSIVMTKMLAQQILVTRNKDANMLLSIVTITMLALLILALLLLDANIPLLFLTPATLVLS